MLQERQEEKVNANVMRGVAQSLGEGDIEVHDGENPRAFPKVTNVLPKTCRKSRPKKRLTAARSKS